MGIEFQYPVLSDADEEWDLSDHEPQESGDPNLNVCESCQ